MERFIGNIHRWRMYSGEKGYFFNGWVIRLPEGDLIVDPPAVSGEAHAFLRTLRPIGIFLTNWTHRRFAGDVLAIAPAPVSIHALDAPKLEGLHADRFADASTHFSDRVTVIPTPGKTLGELGLMIQDDGKRILLLGDTVIGHPAGEIGLLPDAKIEDKPAILETLRRLAMMEFDHLLVGDGESLIEGGRAKLADLAEHPRVIPLGRSTPAPKGC
jgi:glyoxylase-like metal-dependent hydrolase (beta-lactamase superfamily II)